MIKIGTRGSKLAIKQAELVKKELQKITDRQIDIVPIVTSGDIYKNQILSSIGGKGLFTKEIDSALLNGSVDLAVHCIKDIDSTMHSDIKIAGVLKREDPRDVLISTNTLKNLPQNATIGTSSARRQVQLKILRPDLKIKPIRGNIDTRIKKSANFDAIILAYAGLKRLHYAGPIAEVFDTNTVIPSAGQAAIGICALRNNKDCLELVNAINDQETFSCIQAERYMLKTLSATCFTPVAGYAYYKGDTIHMIGMLATDCMKQWVHAKAEGTNAYQVGAELAHTLQRRLK